MKYYLRLNPNQLILQRVKKKKHKVFSSRKHTKVAANVIKRSEGPSQTGGLTWHHNPCGTGIQEGCNIEGIMDYSHEVSKTC